MSDPMPDAIPPEWTGLTIAEEDDSDWEAQTGSTDLSDYDEGCSESSDEEDGDEARYVSRRRTRFVS